jgi:branched-chain amino acid transport system substrate-binding protein
MKYRILTSACCFGLLLLINGCASKRTAVEEPLAGGRSEIGRGSKIETEAKPLYAQAERAFLAKNLDESARLFQLVKAKYPRGRAQAYASYRLGIIHYYKEEYPLAEREFEYFLNRLPQSELSFDATYNLAASQFQEGQFDRAFQSLSRLRTSDIQTQGPKRAQTVYELTGRIASALGQHRAAVAAFAACLQLPQTDEARLDLDGKIVAQLAKMNDASELQQLLVEIHEPSTQKKISDRLQGLGATDGVPPPQLSGPGQTPAENPSGNLPGGTSGERLNVGVVLPLTGKFATYGKRALDAILLASRVFYADSNSDLRIFVRDTNSNPLMAQLAVDDLYTKENVVAIIGPLNFKESVAAAERALQLGVLNLSLAGKEGISEKGPYLFQNALTPGVQLENLVRYCVNERHFQRFAILSPNNNFGKEMSNQFWDYVEKYGAHVVSAITYPPDQTDFQSYVEEMAGLQNPKYRRYEWAKAFDFVKQQVAEKKIKPGKEPKARIPPLVDFDAIFIPDSPKTVAQIGPSLAYFDINGITLLGTTEWNTDQLYKRGGRYVEGAIFPGGLNLSSRNPKQQEFIKSYFEAFGSTPDLLAAQSYEAMELISNAVRGGGATGDRNAIVNQLASLRDFETPLGTLTFDNTRVARRKVPIYQLEAGGQVSEH